MGMIVQESLDLKCSLWLDFHSFLEVRKCRGTKILKFTLSNPDAIDSGDAVPREAIGAAGRQHLRVALARDRAADGAHDVLPRLRRRALRQRAHQLLRQLQQRTITTYLTSRVVQQD